MASATLEPTTSARSCTAPRSPGASFLVPALVLFGTLILAAVSYIQFLEIAHLRWGSVTHDRNAHYLFGLSLANDLHRLDWKQLVSDLDGARTWPPLHGILEGLVLLVGGPHFELAVLPSLAGWVGTILLGFLVARRLVRRGGNLAGLAAVVFIVSSPAYRSYALDTMLESLGACLSLLCLYLYLVAVENDMPRSWTGLAIALTALFLLKANYWLLVLLALGGADCSFHFRAYSQAVRSHWQRFDRRAWLRSQLRQPLNYVLVACVAAVVVLLLVRSKGTHQAGEVSMHSPHNLLHLTFAVLCLRVGWAWWKQGNGGLRRLDTRQRQLLLGHGLPVAAWFLLPKRLGYWFLFLNPATNPGEKPQYHLLKSVSFYWKTLCHDYHLGTWSAILAIGLVIAAVMSYRNWRSGTRAAVLLVFVAAALTVMHPNRKSRFVHSWLAAGWAVAGAGLAGLVYNQTTARREALQPWLAGVAAGALVLAHHAGVVQSGYSPERGHYFPASSLRDLTDYYMAFVDRARHPMLLSTVEMKHFVRCTALERYGQRDRLEADLRNYGTNAVENRRWFEHWLRTTSCDTVIFVDIPPGSYFHEKNAYTEPYARLRELMEEQTVFRMLERRDFCQTCCSVLIWVRDRAAPTEGDGERRAGTLPGQFAPKRLVKQKARRTSLAKERTEIAEASPVTSLSDTQEPRSRQPMGRIIQRVLILVLGVALPAEIVSRDEIARSEPADAHAVALPRGVKAVWDLKKAHHDTTPTRERVCLNGLWGWQPAGDRVEAVPAGQWGFFKVPGFWPGTNSYIQEDTQTLHIHPSWKHGDLAGISAAWYQREITIPDGWAGRSISLHAEYVNSFVVVYVDGKKAGQLRYPAGKVDLGAACRPGGKHTLSLLVMAMPLKAVMLSYSDTNAARTLKGVVARRGLCGDVYLSGTPAGARISDVQVTPSVRKRAITFSVAVEGLEANRPFTLQIEIRDRGNVVRAFSTPVSASELYAGRKAFTEKWVPEKLWDIHTPQRRLTAHVTLLAAGKTQDVFHPVPFGFREFWINGKDFVLNGSRIYLSAVPLDNAQLGARAASYEHARETMKRLQSFGINLVYTHNYGCEPGSHVSFEEILRAADDVGMLVAFSQPHFGHYDWKAADADRSNGYARDAAFYVRAAQNHPSVVAYAMSHNATGHDEDMNPDFIDGIQDPRDKYGRNAARLALRAEAIVRSLDPGRIVYHHSSGNLGSMHTCNFYLNWVPIQELSDWFERWAGAGVKPVFLVEYGVPFSWDWAMYRGWYKSQRSFGSARVPWEFCLAEWNAQFQGDRAYQLSDMQKKNLRWEAGQFRKGNLWHRWDYPYALGSRDFDERQDIFARYITDNWRAFRTWGVSANSPWEYQVFWKVKEDVRRGRKDFKVDWDTLQKPGFSPAYTQRQNWQMDTDLERSDWLPSAAAKALVRNNRPLLAYIAGNAKHFTSKDHNFLPGQTVEKQLILLNNSRETVTCVCDWSLALPRPVAGTARVSIRTGEQERIPLRFELPSTLAAGKYELNANTRFSNGETQHDSFTIDVLPAPSNLAVSAKTALFDPRGETAKLLNRLKVRYTAVDAAADLAAYDLLIIGKGALTVEGSAPNVAGVHDGLNVIVFEQSANVLEQRFGFRTAEYGLREVFQRVPDHPVLAGLTAGHLHDWRGAATLLPPRLSYTLRPQHGPTVKWCGIDVAHAWRCGCRGNVASVLIEKPARGDFLAILDGGFGLQYSPLLEYREGKGRVLFCQLDVTGRTEDDPAAAALTRNLLRHGSIRQPLARREVLYVGEPAGKRHLEAAGLSPGAYAVDRLTPARVLIVCPGGGQQLAADAAVLADWLQAGGHLLAIGLDETDAGVFLPFKVTMKRREHIAAYFEPPGVQSPLLGVGPPDVHNRDPRDLPLVMGGVRVIGNGVLAHTDRGNAVFCQLVPWQFEAKKQMNLRRTYRNASRLVTRLAANLGAAGTTPLLARFTNPVAATGEQRWLDGFYLDVPEEWDDPYRFFRW
jgi:hypothetical protein